MKSHRSIDGTPGPGIEAEPPVPSAVEKPHLSARTTPPSARTAASPARALQQRVLLVYAAPDGSAADGRWSRRTRMLAVLGTPCLIWGCLIAAMRA